MRLLSALPIRISGLSHSTFPGVPSPQDASQAGAHRPRQGGIRPTRPKVAAARSHNPLRGARTTRSWPMTSRCPDRPAESRQPVWPAGKVSALRKGRCPQVVVVGFDGCRKTRRTSEMLCRVASSRTATSSTAAPARRLPVSARSRPAYSHPRRAASTETERRHSHSPQPLLHPPPVDPLLLQPHPLPQPALHQLRIQLPFVRRQPRQS